MAGLRRNMISLGLLHDEGWLYQAAPDKKTLRVMREGKTVMVGEKSSEYQYKLMGSVVEGGVWMAMQQWRCSVRRSTRRRDRPRRAVLSEQQRETIQVQYTEVRAWMTSRWRAYSPMWSLLDMCRICVQFGYDWT